MPGPGAFQADAFQNDAFQVEDVPLVVGSNYTTFQGDVEGLSPPSWDEYINATSLDVAAFIAASAAPTAPVEVLVAADPNYGGDPSLVEQYSPDGLTVENDGNVDTTFIFADRNVSVADTLDVTITDTSQVDRFEGIEGLVAAGYSEFQGDVEYLTEPTWDDYLSTTTLDTSGFVVGQAPPAAIEELVAADPNYGGDLNLVEHYSPDGLTVENDGNVEIAFLFADRNVNVSDALDVAVVDTSQVGKFESVEGLVASNYTTFYGDVEAQSPETLEEYTHVTSLEVTAYIAGQAPPEAIEALIAADPNYGQSLNLAEQLEAPGLTVEDFSTAAVLDITAATVGQVFNINVSDTLNVTVDDTSQVDRLESVVGLVSAGYSAFYGTVEALEPEGLTIENYSAATVQDVAYILATVNIAVTESINVTVADTSTLTKLESIEGLVAAGYSTFFGTVEALFPPQTTIENNSSPSLGMEAFIVLSGPPPPPMPWGPFESVVDDYTWTAVVEIQEVTTSDDVYGPIEPEEGG